MTLYYTVLILFAVSLLLLGAMLFTKSKETGEFLWAVGAGVMVIAATAFLTWGFFGFP